MKSVFNRDFAYLIGNFMADGSLYLSGGSCRFEFVDGSPYENELDYCLQHIKRIRKILELFLDKKLPPIIKNGNMFVLKFRDKNLVNLFESKLNIFPGKKHKTIDIPEIYRNTKFEKDFWIGFLDGDGSIARKFRKIFVESMSKKIINSFSDYLDKKNILYTKYRSKRLDSFSHVIVIRSVSFRDFAKKIGFQHPLKLNLIDKKLRDNDFFVCNSVIKNFSNGDLINYSSFFDDSVFVVNGRELLLKYGCNKYFRDNIKINDLVLFLRKNGLSDEEISKEIIKFRFKKSKGSINSVRLPRYLDKNILKIAKFVRLRDGGITFSKKYVESFNGDFNMVLKVTQNTFDIEPRFTCKNEPLFCSGVLHDFFNKIIKRNYN